MWVQNIILDLNSEIDTDFESRILTSAVINSKHIELRQFFECE